VTAGTGTKGAILLLGKIGKASGGEQGAVIEIYDVPAKKIRYIVLSPAESENFLRLMD